MANRNTLPEGLLDDVKNYLNITWEDEATDQKIGGLIASGMVYLDAKYGSTADAVDGIRKIRPRQCAGCL